MFDGISVEGEAPPLILTTWPDKANPWKGKGLDFSPLLLRCEICNGFIGCGPGNPAMIEVVEGMIRNINGYKDKPETEAKTGKQGVLELTGPIAFSKIVYPLLHKHPCLMVDGFHKIGIGFYGVATGEEQKKTRGGLGTKAPHYSKLRTAIVQDHPDYAWAGNPSTAETSVGESDKPASHNGPDVYSCDDVGPPAKKLKNK